MGIDLVRRALALSTQKETLRAARDHQILGALAVIPHLLSSAHAPAQKKLARALSKAQLTDNQ